jgi:hypothetical protein
MSEPDGLDLLVAGGCTTAFADAGVEVIVA